jgi:hypothetical protein
MRWRQEAFCREICFGTECGISQVSPNGSNPPYVKKCLFHRGFANAGEQRLTRRWRRECPPKIGPMYLIFQCFFWSDVPLTHTTTHPRKSVVDGQRRMQTDQFLRADRKGHHQRRLERTIHERFSEVLAGLLAFLGLASTRGPSTCPQKSLGGRLVC